MADSSPRFRHDLVATAVEVDGVRYVDVRDPNRGTSFRFYDFEYDLARQLDGRPPGDISAWAIATYGLDLTPVGIAEFAARLTELGFLETGSAAAAEAGPSRTLPGLSAPPPSLVPAAGAERDAGRGRAPFTPHEDDSQPLSQVVSRTVEAASAPAPAPASASGGALVRRPSSEFPTVGDTGRQPRTTPTGGQRTSSAGVPAVPRWMTEIDSAPIRPSGSRDAVPAEGPETVMGFAAVTEAALKPAPEMTIEPSEAMGTVMGFAAVTDTQIREAEGTVGAARVSTPPPTGERRLPPRPESVVMAPFQEDARARRSEPGVRRVAGPSTDRPTIIMILVVAVAVIAAVVGYYFWSQHQVALESRRVRVIAPQPAAVYRWFDAPGSAVVPGTAALAFAAGGSVADVLPPGSHYAAGEIIAKLQGAATREAEVNRARSRVAYHQQIRDSMKAAGNLLEMRRAEIKIVEKQAQLDEAEAALDRLVIRASEPGEVEEVVAKRGTLVEASAPAVRVRIGALRGEFTLAARDTEAAAHLGFCRVEIAGIAPATLGADARPGEGAAGTGATAFEGAPRFADCKLTGQAPAAGSRFEVELPATAGILLGQPLRLARVRYDGVFPVPRSAVVRVGETDRLFVVGPGEVAQVRAITIADFDADDVVVSQGIDVGDRVIVDPPGDLRDGSPLTIRR
jgi:hypothetical protein